MKMKIIAPLKLKFIFVDSENQSNPFNIMTYGISYSKKDFVIDRKGDCSIQKCDENKVILDIGSTNFDFSIMGFSFQKKIKSKSPT